VLVRLTQDQVLVRADLDRPAALERTAKVISAR